MELSTLAGRLTYPSSECPELKDDVAGCLPELCARYIGYFSESSARKAAISNSPNVQLKLMDSIALCSLLAASADHVVEGTSETLLPSRDLLARANVDKWLAIFAHQRGASADFSTGVDEATLTLLNSALLDNTFITGHNISVVDIVAFPFIHRWITKASDKIRVSQPGLLRWFNHMQMLPGFLATPTGCDDKPAMGAKILPQVNLTALIESGSPEVEFESQVNKRLDRPKDVTGKKPVTNTPNEKHGSQRISSDCQEMPKPDSLSSGNILKRKVDPSPKGGGTERPPEDPMRLNIIVGKVLKVWCHPDAERLYCEEIDIGEPSGPRRIASGLRAHMEASALEGQLVLVLANLKEKPLRGFPSHGMVLCVTHSENKDRVVLLKPPCGAKVGDRIFPEGLKGNPDDTLSSKKGKDSFLLVQPDLRVVNGVAMWKDHRLVSFEGKHSYCEEVKDGSIS